MQVDPADALDLLMETVVEPNLHPYACVDRDTFRRVSVTPPHLTSHFLPRFFSRKALRGGGRLMRRVMRGL
jgi:hypothetical protein